MEDSEIFPECIEKDVVPHKVYFQDGKPSLTFRKLKSNSLREQFLEFEYTGSDLFKINFSDLPKLDKGLCPLRPRGFIFHLGRCGSTITSQMLRKIDGAVVLSEPGAINTLFVRLPVSEEEQIDNLRCLIRIFCQTLGHQGDNLYIKFSSWMGLHLSLIQRAFPDVPCVFIYRNPVEIMASADKDMLPWLDRSVHFSKIKSMSDSQRRAQKAALQYSMRDKVDFLGIRSDLQVYAKIIEEVCNSVSQADRPVLPISYSSIPQSVGTVVAPYFGINLSRNEIDAMDRVGKIDARDNSRKRKFLPDKHEKQKSASAESRHWVDESIRAALLKIEGIDENEVIKIRLQPAPKEISAGNLSDTVLKDNSGSSKPLKFTTRW